MAGACFLVSSQFFLPSFLPTDLAVDVVRAHAAAGGRLALAAFVADARRAVGAVERSHAGAAGTAVGVRECARRAAVVAHTARRAVAITLHVPDGLFGKCNQNKGKCIPFYNFGFGCYH